MLAKHLSEHMPHIAVVCRRLPGILTNQTATIGVAGADNALDVMLAVVYDVQRTARARSRAARLTNRPEQLASAGR